MYISNKTIQTIKIFIHTGIKQPIQKIKTKGDQHMKSIVPSMFEKSNPWMYCNYARMNPEKKDVSNAGKTAHIKGNIRL